MRRESEEALEYLVGARNPATLPVVHEVVYAMTNSLSDKRKMLRNVGC